MISAIQGETENFDHRVPKLEMFYTYVLFCQVFVWWVHVGSVRPHFTVID